MLTYDKACELVGNAIARFMARHCELEGHSWGPVEKLTPSNDWRSMLNADQRRECNHCGEVVLSDPMTRVWDRRLLQEAMRPTLLERLARQL